MDGWHQLVLSGAFAAGLLGGVHCAAMCGGIIGLVSAPAATGTSRWRLAAAYSTGRIASYAAAGALAGALGQAGLALRGAAALQSVAWTLASATLVLLALHVAGVSPVVRAVEAAGAVVWRRIQPLARHFLPATTVARAAGLGLVWGWLPCGMVYAVLLTAAASAHPLAGASVMAAFGAGTLPNVLGLTWLAGVMRGALQRRTVRYAAALLMAAAGIYGMLHAHPPAVGADGLICKASGDAAWW